MKIRYLLVLLVVAASLSISASAMSLPKNLSVISEEAFMDDTSLSGVLTLGNSFRRLERSGLSNTNLYAVDFPAGTEEIEAFSFFGSDLGWIAVRGKNTKLTPATLEGVRVVFGTKDSIAETVAQSIGRTFAPLDEVIQSNGFWWRIKNDCVILLCPVDPASIPEYVTIPDLINGAHVSEIGPEAFYRCRHIKRIEVLISDNTFPTMDRKALDSCPNASVVCNTSAIYVEPYSTVLEIGAHIDFSIMGFIPAFLKFQNEVWSTDNPEVLAISENGSATAIAPGDAMVYVNIEGMEATGVAFVHVLTPTPGTTELRAESTALNRLVLTWDEAEHAAQYLIFIGMSDQLEQADTYSEGIESTRLELTVAPGTTYYISIQALNVDSIAGELTSITFTMPSLPSMQLIATAIENNGVRLTWPQGPFTDGYELVRTNKLGENFVRQYDGYPSPIEDHDLSANVAYTYSLRSYTTRPDGSLVWSEVSTATVTIAEDLSGKNFNIINVEVGAYLNAWPSTMSGSYASLCGASKADNSAEQMWTLEAVAGTADQYRLRCMEFGGLYLNISANSGGKMSSSGTVFRAVKNSKGYYNFFTLDGLVLVCDKSSFNSNYPYQHKLFLYTYTSTYGDQQWILSAKSASLTTNFSSLNLSAGETKTITAYISSDNSENKPPLSFVSSAPEIASVSANGTVTAKTAGTANITVSTPSGLRSVISVNVTSSEIIPEIGPAATTTVNGNSVTITWPEVSRAKTWIVEVYEADVAHGALGVLAPSSETLVKRAAELTSRSITYSLPDGTYSVRVAAANSAGYTFGNFSTFVIDTTSMVVDKPVVTITPSTGIVAVSWTAVENAVDYSIKLYLKDDGQWQSTPLFSATTNANKLTQVFTPIQAGEYEAVVTANGKGNHLDSDRVAFTIGKPVTNAPVLHMSVSDHQIACVWNEVENAHHYILEVYSLSNWSSGSTPYLVKDQLTLSALKPGTTIDIADDDYYMVRIGAVNGASKRFCEAQRAVIGNVGPMIQFESTSYEFWENRDSEIVKIVTEGYEGPLTVGLTLSEPDLDILNTKFTSASQTLKQLGNSGVIYETASGYSNTTNKPNSTERKLYIKGSSTVLYIGSYYNSDNKTRTVRLTLKESPDGSYRLGANKTATLTFKDIDGKRPNKQKFASASAYAAACLSKPGWINDLYPSSMYRSHAIGMVNDPHGVSTKECSSNVHLDNNNIKSGSWVENGCNVNLGDHICIATTQSASAQCIGFARQVAYDMFGSVPTANNSGWTSTYYASYQDFINRKGTLQSGDYIQDGGHALIVTTPRGNEMDMLHCNFSWSKKHRCMIGRTGDAEWNYTANEYLRRNGSFTLYRFTNWK